MLHEVRRAGGGSAAGMGHQVVCGGSRARGQRGSGAMRRCGEQAPYSAPPSMSGAKPPGTSAPPLDAFASSRPALLFCMMAERARSARSYRAEPPPAARDAAGASSVRADAPKLAAASTAARAPKVGMGFAGADAPAYPHARIRIARKSHAAGRRIGFIRMFRWRASMKSANGRCGH